MNNYDVRRLALVLSVQAEIEGMKVENLERISKDESPAYNVGHFQEAAHRLSDLAYKSDEQL